MRIEIDFIAQDFQNGFGIPGPVLCIIFRLSGKPAHKFSRQSTQILLTVRSWLTQDPLSRTLDRKFRCGVQTTDSTYRPYHIFRRKKRAVHWSRARGCGAGLLCIADRDLWQVDSSFSAEFVRAELSAPYFRRPAFLQGETREGAAIQDHLAI
jgi:hypothetical protein